MRHPITRASLLLAFTVAGHLHASTLIPTQGQTSAQIQSDTAACQTQATQSSQAAAPAPVDPDYVERRLVDREVPWPRPTVLASTGSTNADLLALAIV